MMKELAILILLSSSVAAACPNYPYNNFVWASSYTPPAKPPDTILNECQNINLPDPQVCTAIQNTSLTVQEQKSLVLDDLVQDNTVPPFTQSSNWNSQLTPGNYPPDNTSVQNSLNLQNAWIRIAAVNPAVINSSNNLEYVNATGTIQAIFNFSFVVPKQSFPNDCQTNYNICGYDYSLTLADNGQPLNNQNQPTASFQAYSQNNFTATLTVNSEYQIDHYHEQEHCVNFLGSIYCWYSCNYAGTEDHTDSVTATDNLTAYQYPANLNAPVFVDGFNNGLLDAWLSTNQTKGESQIQLTTPSSELGFQTQEFSLAYFLPPYNYLTPDFVDENETSTQDLSILGQSNGVTHFLAKSSSVTCQLEVSSPFNQNLTPNACQYDSVQQPTFNLTISNQSNASFQLNAFFYDNSTGQPLAGKLVWFSYANQTQSNETNDSGFTQVEFNYTLGASIATANFYTDFQTKSASAYIIVPAPEPWFLTDWYWAVFLLLALMIESKIRGNGR